MFKTSSHREYQILCLQGAEPSPPLWMDCSRATPSPPSTLKTQPISSLSAPEWGCFSFLHQGAMCFSNLEWGFVPYMKVWGSMQLPSHSPGALHSSADSWSQHRNGEQPPRRPAKCWIIKPMFKCLCWQHTPSSPAAGTTEVQDHAQLKEWTGRFEFYGNEGKYSVNQSVYSIS